jgi:hypothetical protein
MWYKDLHVERASELALQTGPQVGQGGAFEVLRTGMRRLVLLDHDQPVSPLVQRIKRNAWFVVDPGDGAFEGRDYLGAVFGQGKGRDDNDNAHLRCPPFMSALL